MRGGDRVCDAVGMSRGNKKRQVSRPAARRAPGPFVQRGINRPATAAAARAAPPRSLLVECPVGHGPVAEVGGLGCCGAETANCEGSLDGVSIPAEGLDDDDPRIDDVVVHFWYTDTGERAPHEWEQDGVVCRCNR
jgi:hypothetical protein